MSLIDDVFGSIPGPLIDQWGIAGTYIKHADNPTYDPQTGTLATGQNTTSNISVRIAILRLRPEEVNGEVQVTDVKILLSGDSLGNYFPKVKDWITYEQSGITRTAKIVHTITSRGSSPILHSIIARLT